MLGPIRIEPGVQFETARMRLTDGEGEWIVVRLRRASLDAGEIRRPRLQLRRIQRIGSGAYLQQDGIEPQLDGPVEDRNEFCLLLPLPQPRLGWPIDVGDTRHPGTAKFAPDGWHIRWRGRLGTCRERTQRRDGQHTKE
ncbi:MAG: hypothetical protein RLZZ621_1940, partial [Gemmatimonadota bacterium]